MKRYAVLWCLLACSFGGATGFLEEFKQERRFGAGFSVGGALSAVGIEIEFNLKPEFSLIGGIGSGFDYSSFAVKGRYFLLGDQVSPYFFAGFARWWSQGTTQTDIGPSVLKNVFLSEVDPRSGFSVWTVYPGIGVQFLHDSGFSVYLEAMYLFKLLNFSNGTYAGLGASWFF